MTAEERETAKRLTEYLVKLQEAVGLPTGPPKGFPETVIMLPLDGEIDLVKRCIDHLRFASECEDAGDYVLEAIELAEKLEKLSSNRR